MKKESEREKIMGKNPQRQRPFKGRKRCGVVVVVAVIVDGLLQIKCRVQHKTECSNTK
jgi:hypothetical protein